MFLGVFSYTDVAPTKKMGKWQEIRLTQAGQGLDHEASFAFCPVLSTAQTLQPRQHLVGERPELCDLGGSLHLPDLLPHLWKEINLVGLMRGTDGRRAGSPPFMAVTLCLRVSILSASDCDSPCRPLAPLKVCQV